MNLLDFLKIVLGVDGLGPEFNGGMLFTTVYLLCFLIQGCLLLGGHEGGETEKVILYIFHALLSQFVVTFIGKSAP